MGVQEKPRGVFYGHNAEVTSVAVSEEFDLCVSGGRDGSVLVHELHSRRLIRVLLDHRNVPRSTSQTDSCAISIVRISRNGDIFVYSELQRMYLFSLNGTLLAKDEAVRDAISCAHHSQRRVSHPGLCRLLRGR